MRRNNLLALETLHFYCLDILSKIAEASFLLEDFLFFSFFFSRVALIKPSIERHPRPTQQCLGRLVSYRVLRLESSVVYGVSASQPHVPFYPFCYICCLNISLQCGRPVEVKVCPECRVNIGGIRHDLSTGNTVAQRYATVTYIYWNTRFIYIHYYNRTSCSYESC